VGDLAGYALSEYIFLDLLANNIRNELPYFIRPEIWLLSKVLKFPAKYKFVE